jgi:integrase
MRGHVRRLGTDRYLVRISAGQDPVTGKRSQPSRVVHGTRQDAELSLAQLVVENPDRNSLRPRTSLDALVERHVQAPTGSGKKRSPASAYRERSRYVTHVSSSMGDRVADKIKPQELTLLYDALIQKGLAPGSVHAIHRLLRAAFSWGIERGLVTSNPVSLARCPSVELRPPRAPSLLTVQAHHQLLQQEDPETALVVRLAATLGLRRSELSGLRWRCIDLVAGRVGIEEGVTVTPGEGRKVTETKTGLHGHGVLSIDEGLVAMLRDTHERLEKVAADLGEDVPSDAYVVSSDPLHRTPINPDTLTKRLRNHMHRHPEIPSFTLKDLRAFTATQLHAEGADVTTAQAVLRHQSPQTTLRHYRAAQMDLVRGATVDLGRRIEQRD